jgi:hypothetical protein
MTARPVLGEFLAAAHQHLEAAAASSGTSAPGRETEEIAAGLRRLITALSGYAGDLATVFDALPDPDLTVLNAYARAAVQARDALSCAAAAMRPAETAGRLSSGVARHFDAAAVSLVAGRDLLQTHFALDRGGRRRGRSGWAPVITSPPVTRALLVRITELACLTAGAVEAAPLRAWRTREPELERRLQVAGQWLALAGNVGQADYEREPVSAAERDLLQAIPGSALPPRRVPDGREMVPELREAVITASQRVSHLAWTASGAAPGSPAISVTSWRQIASAGAATSHHCQAVLTSLASRAVEQQSHDASSLRHALRHAARSAQWSRGTWFRAAQELAEVTTDVRWRTSRAAAEAGDLALWTGRLAYADQHWVPADGPNHKTRSPEDLAPAPADIPEIVGALHYAAEALGRLATSNEQQVRGAASISRVMVPAKSLPDGPGDLAHFASAPPDRTASLVTACRKVTEASARTTDAMAGIALDVRAPSRILATAKAAAGAAPPAVSHRTAGAADDPAGDPAVPELPDPPAGPVEARVRDLGVVSPRLLWRASGIDRLASQIIADAAASSRVRALSAADRRLTAPGAVPAGSRTPSAGRGGAGTARGRGSARSHELEAEP